MAGSDTYDRLHPAFERWRVDSTGGKDNQLNSAWQTNLARDPNGAQFVMTIELVLGSDAVVRVATQPISTTSSATGKVYTYLPILSEEPSVSRTYQINNAGSSTRSVSMQIPNQLIDVASIINSGKIVAGIGEVSIQVDGGDYDDRYVLIRGSMDDGVTFGVRDGETIQVTVSDPKETSDLNLAPFEITDRNWPKAYDSAKGNRYPVVLNSFSRVPANLAQSDLTSGSIESLWLVCYGHSATISATNAVWVNGSQDLVGDPGPSTARTGKIYNYAVRRYLDGDGVAVTMLDMSPDSSHFSGTTTPLSAPGTDASIFVEVSEPASFTNLVTVIRFLLHGFTALGDVGINYRLLGKAEARLEGLQVSACVNGSGSSSAATTMQYIEGELLASFPMVSMVWQNGRYGAVVTDRRDGYIGAKLTVGSHPLYDRISDIQESPKSAVLNKFVLKYDYDPLEDNFTKVLSLDHNNSVLCQLSRAQCGSRPMQPLESIIIKDDNTAAYVLEWMVQHLTFPSYYVEYEGAVWLFFNLDIGDNIKLTDDEFGWVEEIATVEKLEYSRTVCTIGLRVWWRYYNVSGAASTIFATPTPVPSDVT